jgi:hypothetical protein
MERIERIDRYLNGQMEKPEKTAFEEELSQNPALAKDLALQRDMLHFLKNKQRRAQLETQLSETGATFFKEAAPAGKVVPLFGKKGRLAALLTLAATIALILWLRPLFVPSLYNQHAQHPTLALTEKSSQGSDINAQAEKAFNTGEYAKAEDLLASYLQQFPNDHLTRVYWAICSMELGHSAEARKRLALVPADDPAIKDFADWCVVLTYLKEGDKAGCKAALERLPASSAYRSKALELSLDL